MITNVQQMLESFLEYAKGIGYLDEDSELENFIPRFAAYFENGYKVTIEPIEQPSDQAKGEISNYEKVDIGDGNEVLMTPQEKELYRTKGIN